MKEQESTGRQIAKIGRPKNVFDELHGHVGSDGRIMPSRMVIRGV